MPTSGFAGPPLSLVATEQLSLSLSLTPGSITQTRRWASGHTAPAFRSSQPARERELISLFTVALSQGGSPPSSRQAGRTDGLPRHSVLLDRPPCFRDALSRSGLGGIGIEQVDASLSLLAGCALWKGGSQSDRSQIVPSGRGATVGGKSPPARSNGTITHYHPPFFEWTRDKRQLA